MKLKINLIVLATALSINWLSGQQTGLNSPSISLRQAIDIAINQNQDILVARNNLRIADNNASLLNSGYLPNLTGSAGGNYSNTNTEMKYTSGETVTRDGAVSTSYNGTLGINYRLFDGMNRHYNFKIKKTDYSLTELQSRSIIENTLLQLVRSYYDVARLTARIGNLQRTLNVSKTRFSYTKDRFNYGQSTELDVLNSEVDLNNDSVNMINTRRELQIAKNNLLVLLGVETKEPFEVDTIVVFNPITNKDSLFNLALENNADYQASLINQAKSKLALKQSMSGYLPTVDINGSYALSKTDNEVGFLLNSQNNGFSTGLSLSWNIFDGGKTRTQELNARIAQENASYQADKSLNELNRLLNNAFTNYQDLYFIMQVEERNMKTNQRNFERSTEQYRMGLISSLDFRTAQTELQNAIDRYNTAMFNTKVAEMELLKLAGLFLGIIE